MDAGPVYGLGGRNEGIERVVANMEDVVLDNGAVPVEHVEEGASLPLGKGAV